MGSQLKSFLYCTDNSKCVHYGNYSSCIQENWLEKGKDDHQPFCLFGKPSECRYHSLRDDRGKHSLGSEMRRKYNKFLCEYVDFWVLQETKNRKKKKNNGRYVFEIHAHKSGFITQRNGWACPGKMYRPFFGRREPRTKFRRTLKLERRKKSIKQINKKQPQK